MFAQDPERFSRFSFQLGDLLLDYSKHRITADTMELLFELARSVDVEGWRDRMFMGDKINTTENRAVLHVALRNRSDRPILVRSRAGTTALQAGGVTGARAGVTPPNVGTPDAKRRAGQSTDS